MTTVREVTNIYGIVFGSLALTIGFNKEITDYLEFPSIAPVEKSEPDLRAEHVADAQKKLTMQALNNHETVFQPDGAIVIKVAPVKAEDIQAEVEETLSAYHKKMTAAREVHEYNVENVYPKAQIAGLGIAGGLVLFNGVSLAGWLTRRRELQNKNAEGPDSGGPGMSV